MNLKRARGVTAWLLAMFFLRSLIPVGFMPMFGPDHSVQLALCDGYAPVPSMPAAASMDMSTGMDMSHSGHAAGDAHPGGSPQPHQDHGTCPFGASPAFGAPLSLVFFAGVQRQITGINARAPQFVHDEVIFRAQSARGPPV